MINEIKSVDLSFRDKMNRMDWLARNAEFLSPDSITKCLLGFKELYNTDNLNLKNAYINAKHTSNAILTVIHLIEHTKMLNRDDETVSRLAILLSILEPLLINDMNLEKALHANVMELLLSLLYLPETFKQDAELNNNNHYKEGNKIKMPIYLKYALRCITSCVRNPIGIT
jgi:hypothetical protein